MVPLTPDAKLVRFKLLTFEVGVFLSLFSGLVLAVAQEGLALPRSPFLLAVVLYAMVTAGFWGWSPDRSFGALELRRIFLSIGACLACVWVVHDKRSLRSLWWSWSIGAFVACLYGGLQRFGGLGPVVVPQMSRVMSTFGNPIFFAAFVSVSFFVTLALMVSEGSEGKRLVLGGILALEVLGLYLSQTRASWIGWIVGLIVFGAGFQRSEKRLKFMGAVALGTFVLAIFTWRIWFRDQAHLLIWRDTFKMWRAHPFFGVGLGRFHIEFPQYAGADLKSKWPPSQFVVNYAHNEYLQTLSEIGLIGFLPLVALWWAVLNYWKKSLGLIAISPLPHKGEDQGEGSTKGSRLARLALVGGMVAALAEAFFSVDLRFSVSSAYLFSLIGFAMTGEPALMRWNAPRSVGIRRLGLAVLILIFGIMGKNLLKPYLATKHTLSAPDFFDVRILDPAKTIGDLEELVKQYPQEPLAVEKLAYAYAKEIKRPDGHGGYILDSQMADKALETYARLVTLDPERVSAYNNMGNIYYTTGQVEPALQSWRQAVKINPRFLDAQLNLGKVLYALGRLKESSEHFKMALEIDPHNDEAIVYLKRMVE